MSYILGIGILGAILLVIGSAWEEEKNISHPIKSIKNWLFLVGSSIMLIYAWLCFTQGDPIFFVFLEILIVLSSLLMMLNWGDRVNIPIILIGSGALLIWSFYLFENFYTVFFILGLSTLGMGYVFKNGTLKRNMALTFGSLLIALFSFVEANWIFFVLNSLFATCSGFYLARGLRSK